MDEIKARVTGVCLELEAVLIEMSHEKQMEHIREAKKLLERLDYFVWHSHHTSGVPYSTSVTTDWK